MTRHLLNATPWKQIVAELHPESQPPPPPPVHTLPHSTPGVPVELSEQEELRRRQFGPVNVYVRALEEENETLKRRVRVLEQLLAEDEKIHGPTVDP